jgi:G6PDH family F420-dependent oxidoreductase
MSDGRFRLGLGAGERLNEHVVGRGWPAADVRHEMLHEAIEVLQLLWQGGFHSYRGEHFTVEDARIYDLPDEPVPVLVAASGAESAELAGELADGLINIEPESSVVDTYADAGGDRSATWAEVAVSWHADEAEARRIAHERLRFSAQGWKVMAELPNPVNFEAATEPVTEDQIAESVPCGGDPKAFATAVQDFLDAGFEHVAVMPAGDDAAGFVEFWTNEVRPLLP